MCRNIEGVGSYWPTQSQLNEVKDFRYSSYSITIVVFFLHNAITSTVSKIIFVSEGSMFPKDVNLFPIFFIKFY